ncbi:MAG: cadherin repeat domain-containing protein [Chloroflexi bacterium]|nr:cadherin repeat domain-containing protein [Chloroflexota bacterium]
MIDTIIQAPRRFTLYAAVLAMAALVITMLTVTLTTGPAQAQNAGTDGMTNTYPAPQPCGPGAATASMEEPHEVTEGHFALFDAYWQATAPTVTVGDLINNGVLHTNECPPEMIKTTKKQRGEPPVTVNTRSARENGMDTDEVIIHVLNKHQVDVVATNAEATEGKLSLEEYPDVRKALGLDYGDSVPAGTKVWWLRLDDPNTTDKDETSDLSVGFSTALLDADYWLTDGDGYSMRYMLETARYPGIDPAEAPHFFAYEAPLPDNAVQDDAVLDSTKVDIETHDMTLDPGEYRSLQWIFTKPGTYELQAHLQGFVRVINPYDAEAPGHGDWKRISDNVDETSEIKTYTLQVGDNLAESEPPTFGVSLQVPENSPGGVKVGDPIPVYNTEAETLTYGLTGADSDHFELVAATDPHTVQVVVADGGSLDYETKASYNLSLSVTDGVDHEGNPNAKADDTLAMVIDLKDQEPGLELRVDNIFPAINETVNFIARYEPAKGLEDQRVNYIWSEQFQPEPGVIRWRAVDFYNNTPTWSVRQSDVMSKTYRVSVEWDDGSDPAMPTKFVVSPEIQINWGK